MNDGKRIKAPAAAAGDWMDGERWAHRFATAKPWLTGGFVLLIAVLLAVALRHLSQDLNYDAMLAAIREVTVAQHLLAGFATVLSYLALTGYDWSALRYIGARLPYRTVAETSFIAYAIGNTIGVGVLTGGAVRMRVYGAAGIEAGAISRAILFNAISFGLGLSAVGAVAALCAAGAVTTATGIPASLLRAGAAVVLALLGSLFWQCRTRRDLRLFRFAISLPPVRLAATQLAISALDMLASACVVWALLPVPIEDLPALLAFFSIATVLGVISHIPGGTGVFEAVLVFAFRDRLPVEQIAGALVLYRCYYYLLPLAIAVGMLLLAELRRGTIAPLQRAIAGLSPIILAAYTLVIGAVLLISGATPFSPETSELLAIHVPLPLVEASHFIGSIAGLALLLIARGMLQRLDAAWWAGIAITLLAAVTALVKGLAIAEAALVTLLLGTLALARPQFTRRAALLAQPLSGGWMLSVTGILGALCGILFFVYRDTAYTHELWWQFEFDAHAPRSLRAFLAITLLTFGLALRAALRPRREQLDLPDRMALAKAEAIVQAQDTTGACLALNGDKHLLFDTSERAFIMFGQRNRSWVALFDPVGPVSAWPDLTWSFMERAREGNGRASFYQVRPQSLPLYLDIGLRVFKLGEGAIVPLTEFSMQGKRRANLRHGVSRAERDGLSFTLLAPGEVPEILPELRSISNAWLRDHNAAEKKFSLGAFTDDYLLRFPVAVVRQQHKIVAFANVLCTAQKDEVSVDLMRHISEPPPGTMDLLFAKLMLHYRELGYEQFGLGMAPLSGMVDHPLAPRWHRVGRLLFAHGEHFYNFRGLRAFKEKFAPEWEARYLAAPGGTAPLLVLVDVAVLISG